MKKSNFYRTDAVLLLADGTLFKGKSAGAQGTCGGELCFNTGMSGYQEIFTDPSYYGQLMIMNNVHIGNYGVNKAENESASIKISGLICKSFSHTYSRAAAAGSLQDFLVQQGVVGISDLDTRALVRHIRDKGAMNGIISSQIYDIKDLERELHKVPDMSGLDLSGKVTTTKAYTYTEKEGPKLAVLDFGIKENILRCLAAEGFSIKVFPAGTGMAELMKWEPDAFHLSNGPGDPSAMKGVISVIREIIASGKPVFGICLGHQLIAEALGMATYKMKNGHRGINHPVLNLETGRCEITSQNHGFAVGEEAFAGNTDLVVTHRNLNDKTVEGLKSLSRPVFSVQYHPEAAPGPHDSRYLFQHFASLVAKHAGLAVV